MRVPTDSLLEAMTDLPTMSSTKVAGKERKQEVETRQILILFSSLRSSSESSTVTVGIGP